MTSEDNRGPLENLYGLKFPNCDKHGLYNPKQVSHGQSTGLPSHNFSWTNALLLSKNTEKSPQNGGNVTSMQLQYRMICQKKHLKYDDM